MTKAIYGIVMTATALAAACTSQKEQAAMEETAAEWKTEKMEVADSSDYAHVSISIELPLPNDSAMAAMRNTLISVAAGNVRSLYCGYEEEIARLKMPYKAFEGDTTDARATLMHGLAQLKDLYGAMSKADAEEAERLRQEEIAADTTGEMSAVEQPPIEAAHWTYSQKCILEDTTATYATFCNTGYIDCSGAAHPYSSLGEGDITLRRSDGKRITKFFVDGAETKMQALLKAGLVHYYREDCGDKSVTEQNIFNRLQLFDEQGNETKRIPLPKWPPFLKKDGVCLSYAQYEVACYADGMPAFVIPYEDAKPYLTDEVKVMLGLQ